MAKLNQLTRPESFVKFLRTDKFNCVLKLRLYFKRNLFVGHQEKAWPIGIGITRIASKQKLDALINGPVDI
ncbi:hypothetical protein SZ30_12920 [Burkholderia pseudomallei]|nr:hypothetical protein SZ30_12920 [Burkholderia pseudomallei]